MIIATSHCSLESWAHNEALKRLAEKKAITEGAELAENDS